MATFALSQNFDYFFRRLNPGVSFIERAASQHGTITSLIENPSGLASELSPQCFLQGSYKQNTAIYTINDIDIVALCSLWFPSSGGPGKHWSRDEIFATISASLLQDGRYKDKIRYTAESMCIKVDLGIKVEILPAVYKAGIFEHTYEPIYLYRPEERAWVEGYPRSHQRLLSQKNSRSYDNFVPAIKIIKHLNAKYRLDITSFYIECLLFSIPDSLFRGQAADYIPTLLNHIRSLSASYWYSNSLQTPLGDRHVHTSPEWKYESWKNFYDHCDFWNDISRMANGSRNRDDAVRAWQRLLGADYFPSQVSS